MTIIQEVEAERAAQVSREGWTPAHDDTHTDGEMALGAACYAMNAACHANPNQEPFAADDPPHMWPWDIDWWKPKDARRDLIRAAALIVAEVERLDRAAMRDSLKGDTR